MAQSNYQALVEKWGPILEHESFSPIKDNHKKAVTATILENTETRIARIWRPSDGHELSTN